MQFERKEFWKKYREEFGRADQETVDAIEFLIASFESNNTWKTIPSVAYAFATVKHETAHTYRPITEYGGVRYFDKYDIGKLARRLGNTPEKDGDGYKYRGRGYVQLTGKANYSKYGIASNPQTALDPLKAFEIMTEGMHKGSYTGKKLSDYITLRKTDYVNARRIINGTDKAVAIAGYAKQFEQILNSAASPSTPAKSPAKTAADTSPQTIEPTDSPATPPPIDVPQAEGQTIVDVPPVVTEKEEGIVSKIKTWYAALPAFLLSIFGGFWSWIQGAATEIIVAFLVTAGAVAIIYLILNSKSRESEKRLQYEAEQRQKDRDFELTKLQLQSAMDKSKQTVRISPPVVVVPNAEEV